MNRAIDDIRRALDCDAAVAIDKERVRVLFRRYDNLVSEVLSLAAPLADKERSVENKLDLVDFVIRRAATADTDYPRETKSSREAALAWRVQEAYDALSIEAAAGRPSDGIAVARARLRVSGLLERP